MAPREPPTILLPRFIKDCFRYFWNNDYLLATLAMTIVGVARDGAGWFWSQLRVWIIQRLWVTVRLEEKDAELVLAWLRERPEVHSSSQLALYSTCSSQGHSRVYEYEPEIQVTTRLRVRTKEGSSKWIWITRRERGSQGERRPPGATVHFFGHDKAMLEGILEQGREIQRRKQERFLNVVQVYDYGKEHGLNWLHPQEKDRKQPGRPLSSVVLPRCPVSGKDQAEALLEDAREFLASELWYTDRGIPYRRGYLLYGVPGGGKSSLVMAVASELRLPIYMLQLSSEQMNDDTLNTLLQYGMHDPPTILLLEDVDLLHSAVLQRRSAEHERRSASDELADQSQEPERKRRGGRLTLSGLLNALDGPTATTGRLLFMTTNARDRLDPALLRSGRIDYEVEFRDAVPEQIERLFVRFYSDYRNDPSRAGVGNSSVSVSAPSSATTPGSEARPGDAEKGEGGNGRKSSSSPREFAKPFAEKIAESGLQLTTADIQRHLLKYKEDPEKALRELPVLLQTIRKGQSLAAAQSSSSPQPTTLATKPTANAEAPEVSELQCRNCESMDRAGCPETSIHATTNGKGSSLTAAGLPNNNGSEDLSSVDADNDDAHSSPESSGE